MNKDAKHMLTQLLDTLAKHPRLRPLSSRLRKLIAPPTAHAVITVRMPQLSAPDDDYDLGDTEYDLDFIDETELGDKLDRVVMSSLWVALRSTRGQRLNDN